ncbi:hypothetical protein IW152_003517 [Coemansia sp. BCRC 34962]|nr:hypothetical protein IW152_003517 [Coemansia sp. BCRC 34962]
MKLSFLLLAAVAAADSKKCRPRPNYPTVVPPVYSTVPPVYPTASPVYPTASPVYPTASPVYPTASPVYPTASPVYPTASPVYPTASPVYPTASPVHPTSDVYKTSASYTPTIITDTFISFTVPTRSPSSSSSAPWFTWTISDPFPTNSFPTISAPTIPR